MGRANHFNEENDPISSWPAWFQAFLPGGFARMDHGRATIIDSLGSVELGPSQSVIYDREIGLRLLYEDPDSGSCPVKWWRFHSAILAPHAICASSSFVSSPPSSASTFAMEPTLKYRRSETCHSSSCSARSVPTIRISESRVGKIPTTRVRRLISLCSRASGFVTSMKEHDAT